jgi:hypothetical protein
VNASDPIGDTGANTGNSATPSVVVDTTAVDSLVFGAFLILGLTSFTQGTGETERMDVQMDTSGTANDSTFGTFTEPAATTGAYTIQPTAAAGNQYAASAVEIKAVLAAKGPILRTRHPFYRYRLPLGA